MLASLSSYNESKCLRSSMVRLNGRVDSEPYDETPSCTAKHILKLSLSEGASFGRLDSFVSRHERQERHIGYTCNEHKIITLRYIQILRDENVLLHSRILQFRLPFLLVSK